MLSLLKTLIKENPGSEEARVSAAIEIQRAYRGYSTRYDKKTKSWGYAAYSRGSGYPHKKYLLQFQEAFFLIEFWCK